MEDFQSTEPTAHAQSTQFTMYKTQPYCKIQQYIDKTPLGSCIFYFTVRVRFGFVKFSKFRVRVRFGKKIEGSGSDLDTNPGSNCSLAQCRGWCNALVYIDRMCSRVGWRWCRAEMCTGQCRHTRSQTTRKQLRLR